MTGHDRSSEGLAAGALDGLLAMRRDVAVPDDLARRIVVRTAVLPQHVTTVAEAVRLAVPVPPRRQPAWLSLGAGLAASVVLMLTQMPIGPQMLTHAPGQGPMRPLPQVATANLPALPAPVAAPVGGRTAVTVRRELAVAPRPDAVAPAVIPAGPVQLASADVVEPATPAQPEPWRAAQPVTFALAADAAKAQVYGPVLDPAVSYSSSSTRVGSTVGLGFADSGGR